MCEKCGDKGFIELDGIGLRNQLCDCEKAREVAEKNGLPWVEKEITPDAVSAILLEKQQEASEIVRLAAGRRPDLPSGKDYVDGVRCHDDSNRGIGQDDSNTRSNDPGQPQQPKPQRRAKKAGKKSK